MSVHPLTAEILARHGITPRSHTTTALDFEGRNVEVVPAPTEETTVIEDTKATTETTRERMRAEKDRIYGEMVALRRQMHLIDATLSELDGDKLSAEWHRLAAVEDPGAHAAWIRMMAAMLARTGTPINTSSPQWNSEIAAEIERLRSEAAQ